MKPSPNSEEFLNAISVQEMRDGDAYTIAHYTSSLELMYRAAFGVYRAISWSGKSVAIITGSGNNGGDGYALASILAEHGNKPEVFCISEKLSEDGRYYYQIIKKLGVKIFAFTNDTDLNSYDIIVDCILGTGFHGTPRGMAAIAINAINATSAYVVSVDINSGMNGDTGEAELAIRSDKTVSIGFYKKGHFLGQAPSLIGDLVNVDIGIKLDKSKGNK